MTDTFVAKIHTPSIINMSIRFSQDVIRSDYGNTFCNSSNSKNLVKTMLQTNNNFHNHFPNYLDAAHRKEMKVDLKPWTGIFSICWTLTAKSPKKWQCKSSYSIKLIFPKRRSKHGEAWHDRASLLIWHDRASLLIWHDRTSLLIWCDKTSLLIWHNRTSLLIWCWPDFSTDPLQILQFNQHNLVPRPSLSFYNLQPGITVTPCYPSLLTLADI